MKKVLTVISLVSVLFLYSTSTLFALGPGETVGRCNIATGAPDENGEGIDTAIGCIPVLSTTGDFLAFVVKWAIGIGGGIAFLLIIYSGFMIMTSRGDPERMKAGQELLTAAISGLLLLIFSVVILEIVGVDILGLPIKP